MNIPVKYLKILGVVGLIVVVIGGVILASGINPKYLVAGESADKATASSDISPEVSQSISNTSQNDSGDERSNVPDNSSQTTQTAATSDPVVSCTVEHIGNQQMTQSQCNSSFACQIGSSWYLYNDRDKCTADQQTYQNDYAQDMAGFSSSANTTSGNSTPVTYPTVDTSGQQSVQDCIKDAQIMYEQTETEYLATAQRSGVDPSKMNIGTDGDAANQEAQAIYACQH